MPGVLDRARSLEVFAGRIREQMELTVEELPVDGRLVDDLDFDSVMLLEVLVVIEEEFGVFLDDVAIDLGAATLADLYDATLVQAQSVGDSG